MRDLIVALIVFGSIPMIFKRPYIGVLVWSWLSLMNPHRLTWGFAYSLRLAMIVAVVTFMAWLISREPKTPPLTPVVVLLGLFTVWITFTLPFSVLPNEAFIKWTQAMKILAAAFLMLCLVRTRERIHLLVWVVALSVGFYGIRGGVFTVLTGGNYRVWGPPESFIADNNALGLALVMTVPLLQYLQLETRQRWLKLGLIGAMGLTVIAVLGTYSRGAFLALGVMLGVMWLKTRQKLLTGTIMALVLGGFLAAAPEKWFERMQSIGDYQEDGSARGRIDAWTFAFRLALDRPIVGGGLNVFGDSALFLSYVPDAARARNAHSIYFEVLGESGFVGLALFLALGAATLLTAGSIIRSCRGRDDLTWARNLAAMVQVSLIGYASAGAFQNLGFFDLYYTLIAITVAIHYVVHEALAQTQAQPPPRPGYGLASQKSAR